MGRNDLQPSAGRKRRQITLGCSADGRRYQTNNQAVDITGGRDEEGAESGTGLADLAALSQKNLPPTQI